MVDEIDLHGLTQTEAIEYLVKFYNKRVKAGNKNVIDVIHGYGASGVGGVLRVRIRGFLKRYPESLDFEAGENSFSNNPGQTRIFPKIALPDILDMLSEEILDYCSVSRTITKICGKFRRQGDAKVLEAIRTLEKNGSLVSFTKNKHKQYQCDRGE